MSRPYLPTTDTGTQWPWFVKLGVGAGVLMTAVRIYQFKRMPKGQTINQFLMDSRVMIQGTIVFFLASPGIYDLFTRDKRRKQEALEASKKKQMIANGELASKGDDSVKKAKKAEALQKLKAKNEERLASKIEKERIQAEKHQFKIGNKTDL